MARLSLKLNFIETRDALKEGDTDLAVLLVADAAMHHWENYGGLPPNNISLRRFAETFLSRGVNIPDNFHLRVLTHIKSFYMRNRHELDPAHRRVPTNERNDYFEQLMECWLTPIPIAPIEIEISEEVLTHLQDILIETNQQSLNDLEKEAS